MRNVKVITDSTCDLPKGMLEERGVLVIPARVILGVKSYPDDGSVTAKELFEYAETSGNMPKTASPTEFQFQEAFQKLLSEDHDIIYVGLSSKIGDAVQNALSASSRLANGRVSVIDSMSVSSGLGLQVLEAAEMAGKGASLKEVTEHALDIRDKVHTSFVLGTLKFLHMGGRCSRLTSMLANTFNTKLVLNLINGELLPGEKLSGKNYIEKYLAKAIERPSSIDPKWVFVSHCLESEAGELKERLERDYGCSNVIMTDTSPTVSVHGGPGSFGLIYLYK